MSQAQAEFFADIEDREPWKVWRAKGGFEIPYQEMPGGVLRVKFPNGDLGLVTRQSVGSPGATPRLYLNHPITGQLQQRGKRAFFTELACILRIRDHAEKIVAETRELERARTVGICHTPARPRRRNTLCIEHEPFSYELKTIVPVSLIQEFAAACDGPSFAPQFFWLEEREELTPGEKRVYARLATYAGKRGVSRVGHRALAKALGMSARQVIKILSSLVKRNLIRAHGQGRRGLTEYEFLWHPWIDEWKEQHLTAELSSARPVNSVPPTAEQSSDKKREEKRNAKDESPAVARKPTFGSSSSCRPGKTRALSSDEDSGRFARDEDHVGDEVWQSFCAAIREAGRSKDELVRNGSAWVARWKSSRGALALAVEDWKVKTPAERAKIGNVGAYLTERYGAHGGNPVSKS